MAGFPVDVIDTVITAVVVASGYSANLLFTSFTRSLCYFFFSSS